MSSDKGTVAYLIEQMAEAGAIRSRPMFGEYGVYCDDQFVAMICDNQLFIKASPIANDYLSDDHLAPPYPGAKDAYLVPADRWDDPTWLGDFVRATTAALAANPTKKRSRSKKIGA